MSIVNKKEEALRRYGQAFMEETPEILSSKLRELNEQLEQVSEDKKKWYSLALEKAPSECDDKFKLKHLRCEVFRVKVSYHTIVSGGLLMHNFEVVRLVGKDDVIITTVYTHAI